MFGSPVVKTIIFSALALIAFAANSVLCKLALGENIIDASSFTSIRLLSGVLVLFALVTVSRQETNSDSPDSVKKGSWSASLMLFVYAITFSFAYITLDTGTGALILFGAVQITMILASLIAGHRLQTIEWAGMAIAFAGFVYLMLPDATAPSWKGFLLMAISGMAWGIYTLQGANAQSPLLVTAYNFMRTLPLLLILCVATIQHAHYTWEGIMLAALSGGIASAVGYTIWYAALKGLSTIQAAVIQLLVPVIAAVGGMVFIAETISIRFMIAGTMILGGVLMVVLNKHCITDVMRNKLRGGT